MKTIILLLKEAVKQYERGIVDIGDNMLYMASKLRKETTKAKKLIPEKPASKPS